MNIGNDEIKVEVETKAMLEALDRHLSAHAQEYAEAEEEHWLQAILARCRVTEESLVDAILLEVVWREANYAVGFDPCRWPKFTQSQPNKEHI